MVSQCHIVTKPKSGARPDTTILINYLHPIRDVVIHDAKDRPAVVVPVDPDLERLWEVPDM